MRASIMKKQYLTTTGVSAGQVLETLEDKDTPESRAIQRQINENEQAVVDAGNVYDEKLAFSRESTEQAKTSGGVLSGFVNACIEVAGAERITAVTSYQSLDRESPFKFAEHLEKVFSSRGVLGQALADQLRIARNAHEAGERKRELAIEARDAAERSLAASLMKLRAAVETGRAFLLVNGVDIAVPRAPRKKPEASRETPIAAVSTLPERTTNPSNSDEEPDSAVG